MSIKKTIIAVALVAAAFALKAESLTFTGGTDKDHLLYKAGEEIVFNVTLIDKDKKNAPVKGRKLVWERTGDDGERRMARLCLMSRLSSRRRLIFLVSSESS
jgi:hypothetical protein